MHFEVVQFHRRAALPAHSLVGTTSIDLGAINDVGFDTFHVPLSSFDQVMGQLANDRIGRVFSHECVDADHMMVWRMFEV